MRQLPSAHLLAKLGVTSTNIKVTFNPTTGVSGMMKLSLAGVCGGTVSALTLAAFMEQAPAPVGQTPTPWGLFGIHPELKSMSASSRTWSLLHLACSSS